MRAKHGFLRDNRGITPVLSNLLLTVVAVMVMAIATTATYVITTNLRENMSERLVIEDVWFDDSTGSINVYLRNVGKVAVHVSDAYVNHTLASFTWPFTLEIGQHGWLNMTYTHVPGSLYYIDLVTTRGTHVGGYYKTV
jgi:hypothetical protein